MKGNEKDFPSASDIAALVNGTHADPFAVLGPHDVDGQRVVVCFMPGAVSVKLCDDSGDVIADAKQIDAAGIFRAVMPARQRRYQLSVAWPDGTPSLLEDAYRFDSTLGDVDRYLLGEGAHNDIYRVLGAHAKTADGVNGARFAVWAPNASRVSVVGDFNSWDGRRHPMRLHPGNGLWEIFVPGVASGSHYKYELLDNTGRLLPLKSDPLGNLFEPPPHNASIVTDSDYAWQDDEWMDARPATPRLDTPQSIYEVHLGSWRRGDGNRWLSYRELAEVLVDYVVGMGFTHVELMPVSEHPFDGSWGYQPIGLFAPTWRFGDPDDFRFLVDRCHQAGIGVIVDWVPAHFPRDEHGLSRFDGTALYEHEDPRRGAHVDWGTLIFNYGRREVVNYLLGSALYWIREFHIDGLRVDAVASMLYLDYSRDAGEWLPNEHGGNENLEAVVFLKRMNEVVHAAGATTYAEESTAWPGVSRPTFSGGLGFTYKWNMGWMNDSLSYMQEDPLHRKHHHDKMTFGLVYAFDENFVLPLSHDEVVHGKRSLIGRMPGDEWQRFANLRAYFVMMFSHPGKKLMFMGGEFAQVKEWNHDQSLDWHLLDAPLHAGMQRLVRDLNHVYRQTPALFERDFDAGGFRWIDWQDQSRSLFSWLRFDRSGGHVVCLINMTPVIREAVRVGVPGAARYREILNSDSANYGGSGVNNPGWLETTGEPAHDQPQSIVVTLPPLAALILTPENTTSTLNETTS